MIEAPPIARNLTVALHRVAGSLGATPVVLSDDEQATDAFLREVDPDDVNAPEPRLAALEKADAVVRVRASENAYEESEVSEETLGAYRKSLGAVSDAVSGKRWCLTQYPTPGRAQRAEMSTRAYEEFVWDALTVDPDRLQERNEPLVERLADAETVTVRSGTDTDVTFSVAGMEAVGDDGEQNLPGGEVFTAPVAESVNGTVAFDYPARVNGQRVEDVVLRFEAGEVVEFEASVGASALESALATDDGASRLGEFGVGTNDRIDRFTANVLFDEKMAGTIHFALGRAHPETVGEDQRTNESALHLDLLVDVSTDSTVTADGEPLLRDGELVVAE